MVHDYDGARRTYEAALEQHPSSVGVHNQFCRLLLMEVSGSLVGRFGVTQELRHKSFEMAKQICAQAVALDPKDATANMHLGMLYKEALEFDQAIVLLRRALESDPDDIVALTNIASALSRYGG